MAAGTQRVGDLIDRVQQGARIEFLFFWGPAPEPDGGIGKGCLSQWWPAPFDVDGRSFATAEHYMMWRKATLFGDTEIADQVLRAPHPKEAKALGRQVRNFDQSRWDEHRYEVVLSGSLSKFGRHPDLRDFLLATGDQVLVEASPADSIWGIGLPQDDPRAKDPAQWPGLNLLGFALADARATLT